MALKKSFRKTDTQMTGVLIAQECYWKVETLSATKSLVRATVSVAPIVENLMGNQIASREYTFTPSLEGSNFIAQAYEHLKTLPEFSGATDC